MSQTENSTSRRVGEKSTSAEETAKNFGLSPRVVSRYLQIYRLSKPLQDRLDDEEFCLEAAIELSYFW